MQSSFPRQVILFSAAAVVGVSSLTAQTFEVLHSFDAASGGRNPQSGLIVAGNTLYGAADAGGAGHSGTFFQAQQEWQRLRDAP